MLLLQRPRAPGVKGWELRRALGKEYMKIIDVLNAELEKLDLQVKVVFEEGAGVGEPSPEQLDRARFFVLMKDSPATADVLSTGMRVDDLAVLAATVAYIVSRHGKVPRKEVEKLLKEKFPRWRVELNLDRYVRKGYLVEDAEEVLAVGWRTRAEIDQKALLNLILAAGGEESGSR